MSVKTKAEELIRIAAQTNQKGDRTTAQEVMVMALSSEDAIDALDRLLPSVPEPMDLEEIDLTPEQVARVMSCVTKLRERNRRDIATKLLAKVEKMTLKRRKRD